MNLMRMCGRMAAMMLGFAALLPTGVRANEEVSINLLGNVLKTAGGSPMPTTGLVLLVASTNDAVFGAPTAGGFSSGDDVVLARWDLSAEATPGYIFDATNNIAFFGGWGAGDPLAVYWFPTLTIVSAAPTNGAPYGFYRDPVGVDGSFPWVTPASGATISLQFLTADAGSAVNTASAGNASLVVNTPFTCPTITLSPASLPAGGIGSSYSVSVSAGGGVGPYTYSKSSGNLPGGVTLSPAGVLSGTPTNFGTFNFTVTATDAFNCPGSSNYSITISCPLITLSPATLPAGTLGAAYAGSITASGGAGSYTYSNSSGTLPGNVTLTAGGALSGTPTNLGTFNFTVTAKDNNSCPGSSNYSITINCAVITMNPATLINPQQGSPYAQTVTATGGAGSYTYAVTAGALPLGLTLNTNTGQITGTATVTGAYSYTVTATDGAGCTGNRIYTGSVQAISDTDTPKVALKWPLAKKVVGAVGNPALVISGTAYDKMSLTQVLIGLNGGPITNVATISGFTGVNSNWSFTWSPPPPAGSNTVSVKAVDLLAQESPVASNTFFYARYETLSLIVTNDVGTTAGATVTHNGPTTYGLVSNGAPLAVGLTYGMKVSPTTGYLFSNITSNNVPTTVTTYSFVMQSNLALQVNVMTNRYMDATNGWYYGLFQHASGVNRTNAGFLKLKVTAKELKPAKFSGTLYINGNKKGMSGTFGLDGWGTSKPVDLSKWSHGFPVVRVLLPLDGTNLTFTCSVSNENNLWVSEGNGYRSIPVTNYAGNYTLVVKGDATNLFNVPGGDGYGLVIIDTNGLIKLAGSKLADAQVFGQKLGISRNGEWALFSAADKDISTPGQNHSFIMGWLTVSNNGNIGGDVTWLKDSNAPGMYPGLGMETVVEGTKYFGTDPGGTRVLPWTNGLVTYVGGGIAAGIVSNSVTLLNDGIKNKFTTDKANKMTLTTVPKTGKLTVNFEYPLGTKFTGAGAIVTNTVGGSGYVAQKEGPTNSFYFWLHGND